MAATDQAHDAPTISTLVRAALISADGRVAPATDAVVATLRGDVIILRLVIEAAVRDAVSYRTQQAIRNDRAAIIHRATNERANIFALARGLSASLLDMPLAGGVRLRDCDRAFVQREANRFEGLASECRHKARFLAHIAQSVPDGHKVGQVINDERAIDLWKESA